MDSDIKYYPLTHPQKGIWYTEKLYPGTSIGNVAGTVKIKGNIDYSLLEKAVNLVVEKNDSLRLHFVEVDNEPKQYLKPYNYKKIDLIDFCKMGLEKLYEWDTFQTQSPFVKLDLDLYYFALIKIDDNTGGVYIKFHHLVGDGWTMVLLTSEIMEYYGNLKNGLINNESKPSYIEYILNQNDYMGTEKFYKDKDFWKSKLSIIPDLTTLKVQKSNDSNVKAKRKTFIIPNRLAQKMREYCLENRISIFILFLAALSMYTNRITSKEEMIFGTLVLNRSNARQKEMLGMFINTVPICVGLNENQAFSSFVSDISKEWMTVLRHQKYPFDFMLRDIRESGREIEKIHCITLSYQNAKLNKIDGTDNYEGRWHFNGCQRESLCIHINDREDDGNIILDYDYLSDVYFAKEIEFINDHLTRLLWHSLDNPAKEIRKIEMISENEKKRLINEFNNTESIYPKDKCIHQLFEDQAERTPENIALIYQDKSLTYRELNNKSNQLARFLRKKGVGPETIVGLMVSRSFEMIVGIIGIIKAGGSYLPIDPDYPTERISYILDDSHTEFILTEVPVTENKGYAREIIDIREAMNMEKDFTSLECVNKPEDLLYVIYTSGSTGNPKGVMIEHRNVVRLLKNDRFQFEFNTNDIWTMFHSYCFDFSVWEMYGALLTGAKLVIVSKDVSRDTKSFLNLLKQQKVTVLNQTPAAFYNLVNEEYQSVGCDLLLRYVIFGGEALKPLRLKSFNAKYPKTKLINMYGITETTVHVTFKEIGDEEINKNISNIGKPIPTLKIYVVDKDLNLLPIGVPGELCVGGDGVGRGYLNRESLTKQKFVPNPFAVNEIMYRSGDLVRLFPRGEIEYLGRIDNQVKIRGYRIELGEIENALTKHKNIQEALVIAKESQTGTKQLYAFYVTDSELEINQIRSFLSHYLPEYMIPSFFKKIEKVPLTSNGKIDRESLPFVQGVLAVDTDYAPPQNKTQENLVEIWRDILGLQKVGIDDNFFHLGGDSLCAVKVISKLNNNITYVDLYNNPTIRLFSERIMQNNDFTHQFLIKLTENNIEAKNNVICFPYGGGNAIIYKELSDSFSKKSTDYSLYAVNLPGRIAGSKGSLLTINETANELFSEIKMKIKGNIIFYGHCVGSALTIEIARLLGNDGIKVNSIFLGGILPPKFTFLGRLYDPWRFVSNKTIIRFLKKTGLPELDLDKDQTDLMMKAFRHDVKSYYRYLFDFNAFIKTKLNTPIHCIIGDKDVMTRNYKRKFKGWNKYSNEAKLFIIKGGDHYFVKKNADELACILTNIN